MLRRGCVVAGVPIGTDEFVRVHLNTVVSGAASKSSDISDMLTSECPHTLHTLNIRCLQPILSYWTQHCYPSQVVAQHDDEESPAARMDAALLDIAASTQGEFLRTDDIAARRLRLPARRIGGALRSHEEFAHAAFAGMYMAE